ncbi:MAG: DapH/DapD/GlmU-related protein [Verrucomicrobiota bacterium]
MSVATIPASAFVHETSLLEEGVVLGEDSRVWDHVHIRHHTRIGDETSVGGGTTIAYDVSIGNRVKINSRAYIPTAVTIEDGVMISAGVIFTNDRFPRATEPDLLTLKSSQPDEETLPTRVCEGATIGAGATIGCDLSIGRFAMIGMGSVVTRSVGDFHLSVGNPARHIGYVCRCGQRIASLEPSLDIIQCQHCPHKYKIENTTVTEIA